EFRRSRRSRALSARAGLERLRSVRMGLAFQSAVRRDGGVDWLADLEAEPLRMATAAGSRRISPAIARIDQLLGLPARPGLLARVVHCPGAAPVGAAATSTSLSQRSV